LAGDVLVAVLTDIEAVRASARQMLHFAVFYVLLSFAAFQLDGIFIGVSQARQMRDAAALSLAVFILAWWLMIDGLGVSGLWLAMILYVVARALALLLFYPGLRAGIGPSEP
jgi:MATE family multidrug resistance protein